uniref:Uncharacterized protein n=1 Tax=Ananas comosus var. bracteatus TaxID=296719 RepID=A0A6V7NKI4_ANACO|nr:unnamed protein product [Ananas comosus var. bracteatus]
MESAWVRAKKALGMSLCVAVPAILDEDFGGAGAFDAAGRLSASSSSSVAGRRRRRLRSTGRSICAICLCAMKPGCGHALFTAECSHMFHFHCISSSIKHGNSLCPVCRAKWSEIPLLSPPTFDVTLGQAQANPIVDFVNQVHRYLPLYRDEEPAAFNDDEPIVSQSETVQIPQTESDRRVEIRTYLEFSAIPQSSSHEDFTILIHVKAPHPTSTSVQSSRAPIDLVAVIDVSGSMAGTKLALLKRALGFVIQNLGPSDRLSVIAFSSMARRLFHLRRMSEIGRHAALQAVNSLVANGGTNIAEGLKKAAKVFDQRRLKNPVGSIILLSDGQDTYTISSNNTGASIDYRPLIPLSILHGSGQRIPIHAFGFGTDHDSTALHSIAETSSGTFSFIETESAIQDAFAQCIGGLLSVVVQEMQVKLECSDAGVLLSSLKSGGYDNQVDTDSRRGSIKIGDIYADEERDFLVLVNIPRSQQETTMLVKVNCAYKDPRTKECVELQDEVTIQRPKFCADQEVSIEVDREWNRLRAAEAMSTARLAAERGALTEAVSVLEEFRKKLSESRAVVSGDQFCLALDAELKQLQERMADHQRYRTTGRAYMLSGLSSHSMQRATARGNSTDSANLVGVYQTQSMVDMVRRSQMLGPPSPRGPVRPQGR